jgi:sulfur-oxidizing protein SoxY
MGGRMVDMNRRNALKTGGALGLLGIFTAVGLIKPGMAWAKNEKSAFDAKTMSEALDVLGVIDAKVNNVAIHLTVPEIAENGAVVPVTVVSDLPDTERIHILVEKNPNVLAANFIFPAGTESFVTSRVKMKETSMVIALVRANGQFYRVQKEVKVTAGGCGG